MATKTAKQNRPTVQLTERSTLSGLPVDSATGVIKGVKLLGLESKNGRTYPAATIRNAASLYEGAKVNINHPKGSPLSARDYQDRLGSIRGVHVEADGLYGDLHYNPKHALAEQLAWDAEHSPENVGLSHNVEARTSKHNGRTVVETILKVQSVDLVSDPATTNSLYESIEELDMSLTEMTLEEILKTRPDLKTHVAEEIKSGEEAKAQAAELKQLKEELDALRAKEKAAERKAAVDQKITDAKLPEYLVTEVFRANCYDVADEAKLTKLIEDRQSIAKQVPKSNGKPKSTDQALTEGQNDIPEPADVRAVAARYRS